MNAEVATSVDRGGRSTLGIVLTFDRELLGIVRQNREGAKALDDLAKIPAEFTQGGWTFRKSQPDGGLRIETRRRFPNPEALNAAVEQLRQDVSGSAGAAAGLVAVFRDFHVQRTGGFLRSRTRIGGLIDVTPASLFGRTDIPADTQRVINDLATQASRFFKFRVRADLGGRIVSSTGGPRIDGGTATWTPQFGKQLRFSATGSAANPLGLAAIGLPFAAILAFAGRRLLIRRRPKGAVPGWEVGAPTDGAPGAALPAEPEPETARPPTEG